MQCTSKQIVTVFGNPCSGANLTTLVAASSESNDFGCCVKPWDYIESKVIYPLTETLACLIKHIKADISRHIPDVMRTVVELMKAQLYICWEKFCPVKSFCYNVGQLFKSYDLRKAISETYEETQRSTILPFCFVRHDRKAATAGITSSYTSDDPGGVSKHKAKRTLLRKGLHRWPQNHVPALTPRHHQQRLDWVKEYQQ
ncbi:hypothetical protein TNCV_1273371 [Trichonephila clavipes]|nr:hypothetical protein TNCV_1273371 [Trichonephila clavipes]